MLKLPTFQEMDQGLSSRIFYCAHPADMRKGFDSLAAMVREHLGGDPLSGSLFLFMGRSRDRLKILYWDSDGYALWYKRLEAGTFRLPKVTGGQVSLELKASELAMLLSGIDLRSVKRLPRYQRVAG